MGNKRWCELETKHGLATLTYYASKGDRSPKGTALVTGHRGVAKCSASRAPRGLAECAFKITMTDKDRKKDRKSTASLRVWVFCAEPSDACEKWINALMKLGHRR